MPNRENCSLEDLEIAAQAAVSRRSHVRLMAMKSLMFGVTHDQVAGIFDITRRTLSDWVRRFNDQGIDGLIDSPKSGRPRKISPEQTPAYRELVEHPEEANQTHWTAKKFHGYLTQELEHEVGYRTVVRWLHEQGFRLKVPQSWPNGQDEHKREAFLNQLAQYLADPDVEIWYLDESGIEGDPRPRRRWAQKGKKIRVAYEGAHIRMNVTGVVCPRTGEFFSLIFSHSDTEIFQIFLNHANTDVDIQRKRNILICDNASWHRSKSLDWGNFECLLLPPYSPDLNPIERLWLLMKAEWFSDFIAKTHDELVSRICKALNWIVDRKSQNTTTCSIRKKL